MLKWAYTSWSPDDSKIVTCSQDRYARLFDSKVTPNNLSIGLGNESNSRLERRVVAQV